MPTPVSTARQCLTPEAAHALDEAVGVARRRGHGQTTSLHAVSALLSLPSSALRDACARARNSAYSPRLQFKALELCLSVSLDRVPSSQVCDDPPVSNSLMAAIKRSQANQRRQPENFHLYHQMSQQQSSSSSMSCVKVELQNLILSILDDPVVSRVFGEAGFRSSEIKLAIVRPLPQVFKFSRFKSPPMFLCNLSDNLDSGSYLAQRGFSFPFPSYIGYSNGDENCRRIGEVLLRSNGRNPLLVGACAYDTLASFTAVIEKRNDHILPIELSGLSVVSIESEITKLASESIDKECADSRIEEVGQLVNQSLGPGLVLNFGDLKAFLNSNLNENTSCNGLSYVVEKLTSLLQLHGRKLWFIGAAASYETYLQFLNRFPSIENDWDLQLLPITSRKNSPDSYPKSSLMESFVPFGGFFSTPSDLNGPISGSYQCTSRCHLCDEKCEQDILALTKGGITTSVADQYQSSLPTWLQMAEIGTNKGFDAKTKDDGVVLTTKVAGLQKKWDSICQRLHHTQKLGSNISCSRFPMVEGFHLAEDKKGEVENCFNHINGPQNGNKGMDLNSSISSDLGQISRKQLGTHFPVVSEAKIRSTVSKQLEEPSKEKAFELGGLRSCSFSNSNIGDSSRASPASVTSVTTDLNLRMCSVPTSNANRIKFLPDTSGSFSANVDPVNGSISDPAQSSSSSSPNFAEQFDTSNLKMVFRALTERVGWQDEAIRSISEVVTCHKTRNRKCEGAIQRGDLWFSFLGPDWHGKRKTAYALSEVIYGSRNNFITADLRPPDGMIHWHMPLDHKVMNGYDVTLRGKTVVDHVAAELSKKPLSVVFLENVDKADAQTQNTLSNAIRTGKFSDSHGREVGISNATFVLTSAYNEDKLLSLRKNFSTYSEESILKAKCRPMQVLIEQPLGDKMGQNLSLSAWSVSGSMMVVNKRKLVGMNQITEQHDFSGLVKRAHKVSARNLDLNLPADESEEQDTDDSNFDTDSVSDNSKAWLQDFFDMVDKTVVFKPFDFDALSNRVLQVINERFHKIVGSDCSLDLDHKVMEQLLAAAYLSDRNRVVEDWVEQVLSEAIVEVKKSCNLGIHSSVKLVAGEGEEQAAGGYLPQKIMVQVIK